MEQIVSQINSLVWNPALVVLLLAAVVFGAVREADVVWQLGDIGVGLMAWVTVISILILCPKAITSLKEFEKK